MASRKSATVKELSATLHALRVPKSAYQPAPRTLTEAATRGDLGAIREFIQQGSSVKERSVGHASPLHAACSFGQLEAAKLLYSLGAPLIVEQQMFSCIHFAAGKGFLDVVTWALDAGLPIAEAASALANAAIAGRFEVVELLLSRGVDRENAKVYGTGSSKKTPASFARNAGYTALAAFLEGGTFDVAKHEKETKGRVDLTNPDALDPGRITDGGARKQAITAALELIERLDDPNAVDDEGIPLLVRAVITKELALVKALLAKGGDTSRRAEFGGLTALTEACALGARDIVVSLLDSGANIDLCDGSGKTPLIHATARGDVELVRLLIEGGADKGKKDSLGKSAAKYVEGSKGPEITALLRAPKAKKGSAAKGSKTK